MASIEIVTKDDLQTFKKELLADLQQMIVIPNSQMKQWLKSGEVRDLLKISAGTLQTLRINGTLRFTRLGSIIYYKNEDIEKILEGKR